jgi:hypothetical protein
VRFFSGTFLRLLETLRFPLSQPQKRHIQPERYAPLNLKFVVDKTLKG